MNGIFLADKADILVLDDQIENLTILVEALSQDYVVHPFQDADSLFHYLDASKPADLILLDVVMPHPDGFEVCRRLKERPELKDIPVVFLTSLAHQEDEEAGLAIGAVDYITKPFSMPILKSRVRHHTRLSRAIRLIQDQNDFFDQRVMGRTAELRSKNLELERTQEATVRALATLMETRDTDTGHHVVRTQEYVRVLALAAKKMPNFRWELDDFTIAMIVRSAALHDIGKVAIPDRILLKPGKLTEDEFELMKKHTTFGYQALVNAERALGTPDSFLHHARDIAFYHHERWNGLGYPEGISGENIPLSARLMAIADVYDALISSRSYKTAMTHENAVRIICEGKGSSFDPRLIDVFLDVAESFRDIASRFHDSESIPPLTETEIVRA